MPIGVPQGNLDIKNATLRTSNLETQNIKIGSIFVGTGNSLEETANVGNSMSNTIQFTNTHTAFTTTGNVTVGKELTVTGDVTVDTDTLHVDSTNNRIGVGTVSPDTTLDVNGTITGRIVSKTRTITKGTSLSGEVDTFTLGNGENRIILNNNQGSASSSREYTANFNSGVPTEIGTIIYLEINSSRTNSSSSGVNHKSEIQFDGTKVLSTENTYIDPSGSYSRTLKRQIIYTSNGWRDLLSTNLINTGSTSTAALSFDRGATGHYRTEIYQDAYGPDFRVGYGGYTPESILYLKRLSDGSKEVNITGTLTSSAVRTHYDRYGFDSNWRTLIGTSAYDCGFGFLLHETTGQHAMFRFAHTGNGTKSVDWIYNSGYTLIAYSGSGIKVQGPGGFTKGYIQFLQNS